MKRGLDTDSLLQRFQRERTILALLEHPNITRLYDAGATTSGQPYFVMEFVDGIPWAEHLLNLPLAGKVRSLIEVCRAVEYAHQRLTLHRDIKPSNIMVSARGEVKLLDFGAARLLDEDTSVTLTGLRPFTPGYASPEVRAGQPATVSADVFSLGVILGDWLRNVHDGDLAAASAMATRDQPGERYASVSAFRADLENYLAGRPLEARHGQRIYRVRKFLLRHRGAILGAVLALIVVATGVYTTWRQSERAEAERFRAAQRLESLQALSREFIAAAGPLLARDPRSQQAYHDLLSRSAPYLREVLVTRFPPDLLDSFDRLCGFTRSGLQPVDQSCGQIYASALERATGRNAPGDDLWLAAAVGQRWAELFSDTEAARWAEYRIARTPASLARVGQRLDLANIEFRRERWAAFAAGLQAAIAEWRQLPRSPVDELPLLLRVAYLFSQGGANTEALFVLERMLARDQREPYPRRHRIDLHQQLARHYKWQGRFAEALQHAELVARLAALYPPGAGRWRALADALHPLGDAYADTGRSAESIAAFRSGLDAAQRFAAADPHNRAGAVKVGVAQYKLAEGLFRARQLPEALSQADVVTRARLRTWREQPNESFLARDATFALQFQMRILRDLGRPADAAQAARQALDILDRFNAAEGASPRYQRQAADFHTELASLEPASAASHLAHAATLRHQAGEVARERQSSLAAEIAPLRPLLAAIIE